jgi:uncharacterized protein
MNNQFSQHDQARLIRCLTMALEKEGQPVQVFETHISWVLVAGKFAYKFKKALRLDFLDFSTLDARHFYCQEEYRLNRRLASGLYLGVVAITGSIESPTFGGPGIAIEYAVKMHAFPQQALWNHRIESGSLSAAEVDLLAIKIAKFHLETASAAGNSQWGTPDVLQQTAEENLRLIADMAKDPEQTRQISEIKAWQEAQHQNLAGLFANRRLSGMIRECHGDLHSGNILTINDQVEVFDCLEFNDSLRWIDVISDIAFIYMDLAFHNRHELAARLLNRYLEITGDYEGVGTLRYYQAERALVRCKVALLRSEQVGADEQDAASPQNEACRYLAYAIDRSRPPPTAIMITHGYSGSGKSTFSKYMAEFVGAIQIRSDVERKRLHGLNAAARAPAMPGAGLYGSAVTEKTYDCLCGLARKVVESGFPVIVDAAFLKIEHRKLFENLAHELGVPFLVFDTQASEATLKIRVQSRALLGQDPSDAGLDVLAHQLAEHDPLSSDEAKYAIAVNCESGIHTGSVRKIAVAVIRAIRSFHAS